MEIANIKTIYFIGIGGIGMSAIARYFKYRGAAVAGYDKAETLLTISLQSEGINIHFNEDINQLPDNIDVVVYTPAIPSNHAELIYFQKNNFLVVKRSDVLQWITDQSNVIAVAGTHGKTTTSSMVAHILKHSGFDCTAFLGGITSNYNSNFLVGKNNWVVVEADEYDRSFLKLFPQVAIITAVDPDHLDIYKGGIADFENTFLNFVEQLKQGGKLFVQHYIPIKKDLANFKSYALNANHIEGTPQELLNSAHVNISKNTPNIFAENINYFNGTYSFDFNIDGTVINNFEMAVHGLYNIENVLAAIAVAIHLNIETKKIKAAVASYSGVKRRFEYNVKNESVIYIDDYAHHPNELTPFLESVRSIYPDKKITVVFQPHLFSRTRDFAKGFSESLSLCDELILLPIYPAREQPIEGVNSELLLTNVTIKNKKIVDKDAVLEELKTRKIEVLCTVGAGDIDQLISPIKNWLLEK
jgi:UDP-N-acetylmuramate--alanine ligase